MTTFSSAAIVNPTILDKNYELLLTSDKSNVGKAEDGTHCLKTSQQQSLMPVQCTVAQHMVCEVPMPTQNDINCQPTHYVGRMLNFGPFSVVRWIFRQLGTPEIELSVPLTHLPTMPARTTDAEDSGGVSLVESHDDNEELVSFSSNTDVEEA